MPEPVTSIPLILATLASLAALVLAVRRVRVPEPQRPSAKAQHLLVTLAGLLCVGVFGYRIVFVHKAWQPVQAHVDGLLMIGALLAFAVLFIQARPRLFGLSVFILPVLALMLAWGVCASLWTYRPFHLDTFEPAALVFHLATIYFGLLSCALGAAAGGMYLFVQGRLKSKTDLANVNPMASLETLETLIIRSATLGFVLLTVAMIAGVLIYTQADASSTVREAWWLSPKLYLASGAWVVYALLINVRHTSAFRGRRAAWLAIAGLVLVLATYGAVEAVDGGPPRQTSTPSPTPTEGGQR